MTDPQKDEHIEELLSKLQGIFGKLSHSEEEEAKQKLEIPANAPKELPPKESSPPKEAPPPEPMVVTSPPAPTPLNLYAEPPTAPPAAPPPVSPPPPVFAAATPAVPASPPPSANSGGYESTVPLEDPEKMIVPTAVYFPPGRETEAKSLAQKLETMTPKFTKVAFRLRVCVFTSYEPKGEWKDAIIAKSAEVNFQTSFVVMDRPMEDAKRKSVAGELEGRNIYFQEVPLASIEKKAFYTDILLGLVFFFDSRKPKSDAEGTAA